MSESVSFSESGVKVDNPNKFKGVCSKCLLTVQPFEGHVIGSGSNYSIKHLKCPSTFVAIPRGFYTLLRDEGLSRNINIHKQDATNAFMPKGKIFSFCDEGESEYIPFAHLDNFGNLKIWRKYQDKHFLEEDLNTLVNDPSGARIAYATQTGDCALCNSQLDVLPEEYEGFCADCDVYASKGN